MRKASISRRWRFDVDLLDQGFDVEDWAEVARLCDKAASGVVVANGEGGERIELEFNALHASIIFADNESVLRPYFPGRDADKLAYLRDARDFRNLLLLEQKNGDFAFTMARQFLFDTWHYLLLRELHRSTDSRIAEIADKAVKEVTYHLERSGDWVVRLGDGTEESHRRAQKAVNVLWPYTGELFEMD